MRKQQLAIFVSLLLVMGMAAAAQTPSQLDRVNVVRDADTIRVEMSAKGSITPKSHTLSSPARVVVDLPETVMSTSQKQIAVDAAGVKAVRIGMNGSSHPTTRVVVDLEKACAYELTPGPAGKLVLTLHANAVAKATSEVKTVAATTAPARAEDAKAATSPNDYVFVEPSYKPATAKADVPADERTVRAQEAADRFSDKTAAELIPVRMNAAPQASSTSSPSITPAVNLAA
jgi:hypothetical protein